MKTRINTLTRLVALIAVTQLAHAASGCRVSNGRLFNLEPRPNAVVLVARSVAFLLGGAPQGNDLVVATASDARGLITHPNATLITEDAFYVQRSNSNCVPDFEDARLFLGQRFRAGPISVQMTFLFRLFSTRATESNRS